MRQAPAAATPAGARPAMNCPNRLDDRKRNGLWMRARFWLVLKRNVNGKPKGNQRETPIPGFPHLGQHTEYFRIFQALFKVVFDFMWGCNKSPPVLRLSKRIGPPTIRKGRTSRAPEYTGKALLRFNVELR